MMRNSTMLLCFGLVMPCALNAAEPLDQRFQNPPDSAQPGVYWYFNDGNLNSREMTVELESMKRVGISKVLFLEVDMGIPKGPVHWMTEPWQKTFVQAVRDAERLGIDVKLGIGPGWCGSGGPWIKPENAMQHLVFSSVDLQGPQTLSQKLPVPDQRQEPFLSMRHPFYEDVAVFAFPSVAPVIADINEKALYKREPYSCWKRVKPHLPTAAHYAEPGAGSVIAPDKIVDLTKSMKPDGTLEWAVPAGNWTVVRMGRRINGAGTRPAPAAAVGCESDKFDAKAIDFHLSQFVGVLMEKIGPRAKAHGLASLHMDSWESGAQNWTPAFLDEFKKRRGYDARPFLLTFTGRAVEGLEKSERFLWDVRLTAQELVLENHAQRVKEYAHKHGFELSIEPYDMNPAGDLDLGAVADVPMGEFWHNGMDSAYSVFEAASIAHVMGKPVVGAESFTANGGLDAYPWSLKNQGDWAFAAGINQIFFHTFAHQPLGDDYKPGFTLGPHGVHWTRNQTWWSMVGDYHRYLTRCSEVLREGVTVSDVLYLTPEGAPQIFLPPASALEGVGYYQDKKGFGFDGCSPRMLMDRAKVKRGLITFKGGSSYRLMVLPQVQTMTPALLAKIRDLVKAGATVVGNPPLKSLSLSGYPACDEKVQALAKNLWGSCEAPAEPTKRSYGKGAIHWGGPLSPTNQPPLYPAYDLTAAILKSMGVVEDFTATGPVRYGHRRTADRDIYFVSNRSGEPIKADCRFRVAEGNPELWDPVTGERRALPQFEQKDGVTSVPLKFDPYGSMFVVFRNLECGGLTPLSVARFTVKVHHERLDAPQQAGRVKPLVVNPRDEPRPDKALSSQRTPKQNFPELEPVQEFSGSWEVAFDPKWGGPEKVTFDTLQDWTKRPESGIKYYSGIAIYRKIFDFPGGNSYQLSVTGGKGTNNQEPITNNSSRLYLDLGTVHDMARVKLNGKDLGVVWCAPWRVEIGGALKAGENQLEIEVANRWPNRMIGDKQPADANAREVQAPPGFLGGQKIKTGRYTYCTHNPFNPNMPLLPSGLLGPVSISTMK